MDYEKAGVNITEGYRAVDKYRDLASATMNASVLNGLGSFAGMFSLKNCLWPGKAEHGTDGGGAAMEDPVLVSGTDGVGTKLDVAFTMKKYDTVGIDCVAMCVNDILCHGAQPLFFLDYLACGKLDADIAATMVKGVAAGCRESGCALLGGETAEMPGFYDEGKYDIAGFAVGIADRKNIIDGSRIRAGDVLVGLLSSGVHSNGFSLIRKVIPDLRENFGGMPIGMALLEPTRIYVRGIRELLKHIPIHGMAHITGGGFYENIPRMFSKPMDILITEGSWSIPPLFSRIAYGMMDGSIGGNETAADIPPGLRGAAAQDKGAELLRSDPELRRRMFNTFNMGIGFVLCLAGEHAERAVEILEGLSYPARIIGEAAASSENSGEAGAQHKGSIRFVSP